jgi:hypothetical protein
MAKRKIIRKSNRPLTINSPRYYSWGGDFKTALGTGNMFNLKDTFSGANVAGMLKGGLASGIGSAVGKIGGGLIGGDLESGAGSAISNIGGTIGGAVSMVNPVLGGIISAGSGIIGGLTNRMFGSKMNEENIAEVEEENKAMNTLMLDSSSADSLEDQWASQNFGGDFSQSDIGKDGWFSNKAKNKYKELKKQQDIARNRALTAFDNASDAIDTTTDLTAMANFAAYGGPLGMWDYGSGAIDYELANENLGIKELNTLNKDRMTSLPNSFQALNTFAKGGKIHIKKANRGKFTEYCGGKVTSECIAKGKRSSNPAVRKRATFAANARKWKHAFGGDLLTNGVEWSNGLKTIDNGGTHEENPMEGVPMGIAPDGQPNLVEEGEVIYNNYVFSNRMFADKKLLEDFKLPKAYDGYSFAAIAERLGKESKERPNDPISKRGLMSSMTRLQQAQETMRQKGQVGQEGKEYAHGGKMGILFDGEGDIPNLLGDWQDFGVLDTPITTEELESMMKRTSAPTSKDKKNKLSYLRYAPILGSAIGLGYNIFKKPDYSGPDAILEAAEQVGNYTPIGYTPIGNYLTYRPLDRNYYINKLNAQAGATRRAILNTTSPARNAALLAADYNALGRLGDLARQAEEYNLAQRERVEGFNRQTNMANSEMGLKASMFNQEAALKAKSQKMSGVAQAYAMRDAIDARRSVGISANLTNLFDSLGNVGKEEFAKDMIENNPALLYDWLGKYKGKKSKGGYLTVKKRRR